MKTVAIALLASISAACGGTVEPPTYGPDAEDDAGSIPDEATVEDAADAAPLHCGMPNGAFTCAQGFYCIVPASGQRVECDADGGPACVEGWACSASFFDAAIGVVAK